jgi:hypothetical protein
MSKFGEIAFTRFARLRSIEYGGGYRIARRARAFLNSIDCEHCKKTEQFAADLPCYSKGVSKQIDRSLKTVNGAELGRGFKSSAVERTLKRPGMSSDAADAFYDTAQAPKVVYYDSHAVGAFH